MNNLSKKLAATSAFAIVSLLSITAFADGIAVRYSYAKTEFNGQTIYALIPTLDRRFTSAVSKANITRAFDALKSDKSNTYLNTAVTVSGSDRAPRVSVKIDPNAAAKGYSLIIMAETVYTLGELGVTEVSFPNYASRAMSRGDIPFVAFSVTVPLWKALTPGNRRDAINSSNIQVVMPDGTVVPSTEIVGKWRTKDKSIETALYDYLKAPDSYTVKEVAKLLKGWNLPYGDKVVQLLGNPSTSVQTAGLELLADQRDDKRVLDSVKAYLDAQRKTNKSQAALAAAWLGKAKDKTYAIEEPLYFLDYGTPEQAIKAAAQLSDFEPAIATKALSAKLEDKNQDLAVAAANALGKMKNTSVEKAALDSKKISQPVKLQIAKNLAEDSNTDDKLQGLAFLVQNGTVKDRTDAVTAIAAIPGNDSLKILNNNLASDDEFVSEAVANQLLKRADINSLDTVAKAMKSGKHTDMAQEIGDAIMQKLDFQTIERRTRDHNEEIQRLAYRALSKKAKIRSVLELLEHALDNKNPSIRGAAAFSLLDFNAKYPARVEAALKKTAKDNDASVRRDTAIAIGSMPEGKLTEELTALLKDKDPSVSAEAISSLAKRNEAFAWDDIKAKAKSSNADERAAAVAALAKLVAKSDAKGVKEVISLLSGAVSDKNKNVKIAAIEGLGEFKDDRAVASIAVNASSDDIAIRMASLRAVAKSGHASAKPILVAGLDDKDAAVRAEAVRGLAILKDHSAKSDLTKRLKKETDPDIRDLIVQTEKKL